MPSCRERAKRELDYLRWLFASSSPSFAPGQLFGGSMAHSEAQQREGSYASGAGPALRTLLECKARLAGLYCVIRSML